MTVPEGETRFAQQPLHPPTSVKKLAQQAIKRPFLAILPALGEYFHTITIKRPRWANFFATTLLTAPRHETVNTTTGTSGRLHETHDAFARQNSAENGCIWLAMVPSVSPKIEHTPAKAMTVSPESPTEPVGGGGAWPRRRWVVVGPGRTSPSDTSAASVEGAGGSGGHGRASRSTTPSKARVWRSRGRPGPTAPGTPAAPQQRPGIQKTDIRIGCRPVVELGGFEPPTFSLRTRRATNCAIAPRTRTA